jgi:hypothetical protein
MKPGVFTNNDILQDEIITDFAAKKALTRDAEKAVQLIHFL